MRTLTLSFLAICFALFAAIGCKSDKAADAGNSAKTDTTTPTPAPAPAPVADPLDDFLTAFKAAVAANDGEKLSAMMRFPLDDGMFADKATYMEMHNAGLFDENFKAKVAACTKADWKEVELGGKKTLGFVLATPAGAEGESSLTITIDKVGDKYQIVGMWLAG